jgi:hypothetical protein
MSTTRREPAPSPAALIGWLRGAGWTERERNARWASLGRAINGEDVIVDVPLLSGARDYPRAAFGLLQDLAEIEQRDVEEIRADLRGASVDTVRLRLRGHGLDLGSLPLASSVDTLQAARHLCLAAACSAVDPRPAYLGRKPEKAMAFLESARWARVERGSLVLCLEVPVPPRLQSHLFDEQVEEPEFSRLVTTRLATGTAALARCLPDCMEQGSLGPVEGVIGEGVSANLCDATADLLRASRAESLELAVSFAVLRPPLRPVPRAATFLNSDLRLLQEIARGLHTQAADLDIEIVGPVVRLYRGHEAPAGQVTLQAAIEGRPRLVRIDVDGPSYEVALHAHRDYAFVRAAGTLRARASGGFDLTPTRPLSRAEVQDAG